MFDLLLFHCQYSAAIWVKILNWQVVFRVIKEWTKMGFDKRTNLSNFCKYISPSCQTRYFNIALVLNSPRIHYF